MQNLDGEENANTLTFGSEFENVSCLSNAEVSIVLEKQKDSYAAKDLNVTPHGYSVHMVFPPEDTNLVDVDWRLRLHHEGGYLLPRRVPFRAFAKTMTYAKRFGGVGGNAKVTAVSELREALQQFETFHDGEVIKLHQFEVMQLANLMMADSEVEEVLALIPSLGAKLTEEDIENVLTIVRKHQHTRLYS